MTFSTSRVATLIKELDDLDSGVKFEQVVYGSLKNEAMEKGNEADERKWQERLDKYMEVRSAIDTIIEYLDGCEVRL